MNDFNIEFKESSFDIKLVDSPFDIKMVDERIITNILEEKIDVNIAEESLKINFTTIDAVPPCISSTLSGLNDTGISNVQEKDMLVYENSKWRNKQVIFYDEDLENFLIDY